MDSTIPKDDDIYSYIKEFRGPPTTLQLCLPVLTGIDTHPQYSERTSTNEKGEFHKPLVVAQRVAMYVQRWGRVVPIDPVVFLHNILEKRGYETELIATCGQRK